MNRRLLILCLMVLGCAATARAQTNGPTTQDRSKGAPGQLAPAKPEGQTWSADRRKEEDCGCEVQTPYDPLAVLNGMKIFNRDIDEQTRSRISLLQREVVESRERELDLQINSKLLSIEAKRRGVSTTGLIEAEVLSKVTPPTASEAQAFYELNKDRIQGEFKDVKDTVIAHLLNQRRGEEAKKLAERLRAAAEVKSLVARATPPERASGRERVFAIVNGERITSGDVEDALRPLIFSVQEQVYNLRKRALDLKINDMLLEQEAQKRKITTNALLEGELAPKIKRITEKDAQEFYEQNKERISGDYAQLKEQIIKYLHQREANNAQVALATQLRQSASLEILLAVPAGPVYNIASDDQPSKGSPTAQVTIVEFTDYECQSCAQAQPIIETLVKEYGEKVRLIVRDFPLERHANAFKAAEAAEAAREQGKYWEYAAKLFQNQSALGVDRLKQYAAELGLDRARFDAALDGGKFTAHVRRDMLDGQRIGVNGTPSLFINGRRVTDRSYEGLKRAIEATLSSPAGR